MRKLALTLLCAAAFFAACPAAPGARRTDPAMTVYASLPWLSGMARFIVGTTMKIQPASYWTPSGELRRAGRMPRNSVLIALDQQDAKQLGAVPGQRGLRVLYENLPVEDAERGALPFNPSVLPFMSQRMLKILCELNPGNYSFYQRRLAEFQSRLESTVEVGRSLIGEIWILDLTGSISPWIRSASSRAIHPPEDLWNAWAGSTRTPELAMAVREAESRGWWILTDAWTPIQIKARVSSSPRCIEISSPETNYEFFTYLHDIYLQIWSQAVAK